jgi:hypothetical protein
MHGVFIGRGQQHRKTQEKKAVWLPGMVPVVSATCEPEVEGLWSEARLEKVQDLTLKTK